MAVQRRVRSNALLRIGRFGLYTSTKVAEQLSVHGGTSTIRRMNFLTASSTQRPKVCLSNAGVLTRRCNITTNPHRIPLPRPESAMITHRQHQTNPPAARSPALAHIYFQGHHFTFGAGCVDECYMFFVRDPVDRWLSRFIMRERDFKRNPEQYERVREVFEKYPTPNHLAEALSSADPDVKVHAVHTFHSSDAGVPKKLSKYYLPLLFDEQTREEYMKRVVFVGATSLLGQDITTFAKKVGLPPRGTDHFEKLNAMPKEQRKELYLSRDGLKNVEKELEQEYEMLNILFVNGLIKHECTHRANCAL